MLGELKSASGLLVFWLVGYLIYFLNNRKEFYAVRCGPVSRAVVDCVIVNWLSCFSVLVGLDHEPCSDVWYRGDDISSLCV